MEASPTLSSYLAYLPASFQVDAFLGRFLLAFERVLSGLPGDSTPTDPTLPQKGLEQIYEAASAQFDPQKADPEFLPWLAGWVATSLRDDWTDDVRRNFIAKMAFLYRRRGTKDYLKQLLLVYLGETSDVTVDDSSDTPNFFTVSFSVSASPSAVAHFSKLAQALIDQEKPAHTYYHLAIRFPTMMINDHPNPDNPVPLIIGTNTILGTGTFKG